MFAVGLWGFQASHPPAVNYLQSKGFQKIGNPNIDDNPQRTPHLLLWGYYYGEAISFAGCSWGMEQKGDKGWWGVEIPLIDKQIESEMERQGLKWFGGFRLKSFLVY